MFKTKYDKFQRWLAKFKPEHLDRYEKGHNKGEIDIKEITWGYHLFYKGELLGTLIESGVINEKF